MRRRRPAMIAASMRAFGAQAVHSAHADSFRRSRSRVDTRRQPAGLAAMLRKRLLVWVLVFLSGAFFPLSMTSWK